MKSVKVLPAVVLVTRAVSCLPLKSQIKELEDRLKEASGSYYAGKVRKELEALEKRP